MKRVFANFNLRKSAYVLGAAALLTLGSAKAHATPIIEKIISPADKQVNVTFVEALISNFDSILILTINQVSFH